MNILLLGSGGRENALAWKIAQSPRVENLYIAPGNAGTARIGRNIALSATDFPALKEFAMTRYRHGCRRPRRSFGKRGIRLLQKR